MTPGAYVCNTLAMWSSLEPWAAVTPGSTPGWSVVSVPAQATTRIIAGWPQPADPGPIAALLAAHRGPGRLVIEDPAGGLPLPSGGGITVDRYPLMVRPPGGTSDAARASATAAGAGGRTEVQRVAGHAGLIQAEQVIVDGFPQRGLQPYRPGRSVPPRVLATAGWAVWLATRDGEPAGACCSYDDGTALGIYWVATLPRHRSRGVGRAVVTAALAAAPARPAVLVATSAGQPLYTALGFRPVAMSAWHRTAGPTQAAQLA